MSSLTITLQGVGTAEGVGGATAEFVTRICLHIAATEGEAGMLAFMARVLPAVVGVLVFETDADRGTALCQQALADAIAVCKELEEDRTQIDAAAPPLPAAEGLH